ncbi:MAG: cytidylate kinase family protein, partial [Tidjanibacter sp.]|nr:cytidylate kinase family protein [Tidjanibacter sp.]
MKNVVITIGRQLGSGGGCLAKELKRRLGLPIYHKDLICEAAKQSGI